MNGISFATRLNAFATSSGKRVSDMITGASKVSGLTAADLNYPDHFVDCTSTELTNLLSDHGLRLNGLAMRYGVDSRFRLGAFTNPDRKIRRAAIEMTKKGIDTVAEMGGTVMTVWLGQDGVDYSFQGNYERMWDDTVSAFSEVADHNPGIDVSIEYKPNEPRAYAFLPDIGTNLLAIAEAGKPNLGLTLDFAHVLYADEIPACTAMLINRKSRLFGVHLNDGYGKRDDGLMVASVHLFKTLELFVELIRINYQGVIYFDTFPDHGGMDPVEEAETNVRVTKRLLEIASELVEDPEIAAAIRRQNSAIGHRALLEKLLG